MLSSWLPQGSINGGARGYSVYAKIADLWSAGVGIISVGVELNIELDDIELSLVDAVADCLLIKLQDCYASRVRI